MEQSQARLARLSQGITSVAIAGPRVGLETATVVFFACFVGMSLITRFTVPRDVPQEMSTPQESFRTDLMDGVIFGALSGLSVGVAIGISLYFVADWQRGAISFLISSICFGIGGFLLAPQSVVLMVATIGRADRCPPRMMTFLKQAQKAGVFRQVGMVYQFRHAELQDHLSLPTPVHLTPPLRNAAGNEPLVE